jgi:hypothetical protein
MKTSQQQTNKQSRETGASDVQQQDCVVLCARCETHPATNPHPCPFQQEIHFNSENDS